MTQTLLNTAEQRVNLKNFLVVCIKNLTKILGLGTELSGKAHA
jgi:hypothetical protein